MKRVFTFATCFAALAGMAFADAILTYDDQGMGGETGDSGSYAPGSSFAFDISLTVTSTPGPGADSIPDMQGFSLWFETAAVSQDYFTITNRTVVTFEARNSPALQYPQAIRPGGNTPPNTNGQTDLGGFDGVARPTNATYSVIDNLTIQIAPNTPAGVYTIFNTTSGPKWTEVSDSAFIAHFLTTAYPYTITVIPEPATTSHLAFGGLALLLLIWLHTRRAI